MSVILFIDEGMHGGGMHCGGVCMAGDMCVGRRSIHSRERAWQVGVNEWAVHIILEYILVILILLQNVNVKPHSH